MNTIIKAASGGNSPFDSIRRIENGWEFWLATELLKMLGYQSWKRIKDTVERAILSLINSGQNPQEHVDNVVQIQKIGDKGGKKDVIKDYKLSRHACYLVAMVGDPRKPEVAAAQNYFAVEQGGVVYLVLH